MRNRYRYRVPVYKNDKFVEFEYLLMGEELPALCDGKYKMAQQCTGIEDDNGWLIYEGDILTGFRTGTCCVEWNDDIACFQFYFEDGTYELFGECFRTIPNAEIIGNLCENPELVKGYI